MSLYNMINGVDPACFYLLPMLGRVAEDYPRFRDCFLSEDGEHIDIYTRVGGNNRNHHGMICATLRTFSLRMMKL